MEENQKDPPQQDQQPLDHTKAENDEQETPITEVMGHESHSQPSQSQATLTPHHSPMPQRPMNQFPQSNHMAANTQPTTTFTEEEVFVGDLSYFCTEAHLQQFFASIGEVLDVRIRWSNEVRELGHSLMHGFVTFRTAEEAQRAVAEKNGELYMGRNIRVQPCVGYSNQDGKGKKARQNTGVGGVHLHISFITTTNVTTLVTEEYVRSIYEHYGEVGDVTITRHNLETDPPKQCGYGFVFMKNAEQTHAAMPQLTRFDIDEIRFDSVYSSKERGRQEFNTNMNGHRMSRGNADSVSSRSPPPMLVSPHPGHNGYHQGHAQQPYHRHQQQYHQAQQPRPPMHGNQYNTASGSGNGHNGSTVGSMANRSGFYSSNGSSNNHHNNHVNHQQANSNMQKQAASSPMQSNLQYPQRSGVDMQPGSGSEPSVSNGRRPYRNEVPPRHGLEQQGKGQGQGQGPNGLKLQVPNSNSHPQNFQPMHPQSPYSPADHHQQFYFPPQMMSPMGNMQPPAGMPWMDFSSYGPPPQNFFYQQQHQQPPMMFYPPVMPNSPPPTTSTPPLGVAQPQRSQQPSPGPNQMSGPAESFSSLPSYRNQQQPQLQPAQQSALNQQNGIEPQMASQQQHQQQQHHNNFPMQPMAPMMFPGYLPQHPQHQQQQHPPQLQQMPNYPQQHSSDTASDRNNPLNRRPM